MVGMVSDPDTLAYVERRAKEGKSKHEIIRRLNALSRSGIPPRSYPSDLDFDIPESINSGRLFRARLRGQESQPATVR
jgi:hypothetical protein